MATRVEKYFIVTFGCQANESDSERIIGWYKSRGWQAAKTARSSTEVIYNSCSVRQSAEDRVIGQIYQLDKYKKKNKQSKPKIILTGCMTRMGARYLKKKIPGLNEIRPISKFDFKTPVARQKKDEALVPIMTGCDNYCTYCVVPYARGKEWSRPLDEILCEVNELVKKGCHTTILLGQNVNSYKKNQILKIKDQKHQKYLPP